MNQGTHEQIMELPDIPVMYRIYESQGEFVTNHWHESLEVLYILHGHLEVYIQDNIRHLRDDDYIIINSGDIHSTLGSTGTVVYLLQLTSPFLERCFSDYHTIRFEHTDDFLASAKTKAEFYDFHQEIKTLLRDMGTLYSGKEDGYSLAFQSYLFRFLYLLNQTAKVRISPLEKNKSDKNREQLSIITTYVSKHYKEKILLKDAADAVGLQQEYFCRFFKRYMGMTFVDYVNQVRLSYIYEDLMNTDYSIYTILEHRGFTNYKLFMKLFKEKYGCTPSQKRKSIFNKELS